MKFKIGDRIKSISNLFVGELGTIIEQINDNMFFVKFDNGKIRGKKIKNIALAFQAENFKTVKEYLGVEDTLIDED